MSQPFSGMPEPGGPRPMRRRFQPGVVQEALRSLLGRARRYGQELPRYGQQLRRYGQQLRRYGQELWLRGKRKPRTVALVGGAVVVTLGGAYALNASGVGGSACASAMAAGGSNARAQKDRKAPRFLLLMDPVAQAATGSELEIHYDVCGLASGTAFSGRVKLTQQQKPSGKKKKNPPKPKTLVVNFEGKADGVATRRSQELNLGSARPGTYTLELSVTDNQGRERKRLQKILVKAQ